MAGGIVGASNRARTASVPTRESQIEVKVKTTKEGNLQINLYIQSIQLTSAMQMLERSIFGRNMSSFVRISLGILDLVMKDVTAEFPEEQRVLEIFRTLVGSGELRVVKYSAWTMGGGCESGWICLVD